MASERIQQRLEEAIQSGNYYEAHQMLRTQYNRQIASKQFDICRRILINGCRQFYKIGEIACVADLAESYATMLCDQNLSSDKEYLEDIAEMLFMLPPSAEKTADKANSSINSTNAINRDKFVATLLKWSKKVNPEGNEELNKKHAEPKLNTILAKQYWRDGQLETAKYYFARSDDGTAAGRFSIEYQLKNDVDIEECIAQITLQLLAMMQSVAANEAISIYCQNHPKIGSSPPLENGAHPMINYVYFLSSLVIRKEPLTTFVCLGEKYSEQLVRFNTRMLKYIDKIGQIYFGLAPPSKQVSNGGLFANMLKSLADINQDDDDDNLLMRDAQETIEPERQLMQTDELD